MDRTNYFAVFKVTTKLFEKQSQRSLYPWIIESDINVLHN